VAAPPYDVVSRAEASRLAGGNPNSFLRVARAEIDLPETVEPHDTRVYARARQNLDRLIADGVLVREPAPAVYVYRLAAGGHVQTGVVGCVDVAAYEAGDIRKHETTRPDKEDDRTRHILTLRAQAEPVLLAYRSQPGINALAAAAVTAAPLYDVVAPDGVRHIVWAVADPAPWVSAFREVPRAYIADGHHRSAAALRAARELRTTRRGDDDAYERFLAVLFPADDLRILPYNRLVKDLGGLTPDALVTRLRAVGRLEPTDRPDPPSPRRFGLYMAGRWHLLTLPESAVHADPIRSLDVSLLAEHLLAPILGIPDQRTDPRIDFVGGRGGAAELERRVDGGEAALGIALHPTSMAQLLAVSDLGGTMPPKSTWFEPKLLSGLFVHPFD
jgi:uncharacterized protein (DUF1015 family)